MIDPASIAAMAAQTPNRGRLHVFLGDPEASLCDTTTVEPGNVYSPGVWTWGVSVWVGVGDMVVTPALLGDREVGWGFGEAAPSPRLEGVRSPKSNLDSSEAESSAGPPVLRAVYRAGAVRITHDLCHLGGEGAEGADFSRVVLDTDAGAVSRAAGGVDAGTSVDVAVYLVVTGTGPAGGVIDALEWDAARATLTVNGSGRLCVEAPTMAGHTFDAGPSADGVPVAVLSAAVRVAPGHPAELRFRTEHAFDERVYADLVPKMGRLVGLPVETGLKAARARWEADLPARVFAPDPRVAQVWGASAYHILAAMEEGQPRVGAVNYPIFWIRDGVMILRALDLIGRHDLARRGCDSLMPLDFAGGFGAESDAPGEGIWALVGHARITGARITGARIAGAPMSHDTEWLARAWPHIARRVAWLERMRTATQPLRAVVENRKPETYNTPAGTVLCLPADDGLIHGRMDWHAPDFYINCWALAGYREAAWAAAQLGIEDGRAEAWRAEADRVEALLFERLLPQYGNERDPTVAPYPTGAFASASYREALAAQFGDWYRIHRLDEAGARRPERLWTYFEAAQIHNALLLGFKDEAWTCLDGMLDDATAPWRVAAWVEGLPGGGEMLPFRNDVGARGWLRPETAVGGNMPHNWTSAEVLALLRALFVHEEGDRLLLGLGVPAAWLKPGTRFGVQDMPTRFGPVSYTVTVDGAGVRSIEYSGPAAGSWVLDA